MYSIRLENAEISTGETSEEAFRVAEGKLMQGRKRFSRYVDPAYREKPYEIRLTVHGGESVFGGELVRHAVILDPEAEFVFCLGGITSLVDAGLLSVEEGQQDIDRLKADTSFWSSIPRERVRTLLVENFRSTSTRMMLVDDRMTVCPTGETQAA